MISIRSIGVAWLLQYMELSLHTVEVVGISTREAILPPSLSSSIVTLHCSCFSGFLPYRLFCHLIRYVWHS